jgi:hypothetical protein
MKAKSDDHFTAPEIGDSPLGTEEFRAVWVVTTETDSNTEPSDHGAILRSVVVCTPPAGRRVLSLRSLAVGAVRLRAAESRLGFSWPFSFVHTCRRLAGRV